MRTWMAGIGLLAALAAGCSSIVRLPTIASDGSACRGVGLDGVLHGSPSDPHVAWVESQVVGNPRIDVVFPQGFTGRFDPSLEVLDADGHVVAMDGDPITGGCVTGPDAAGPLLILGVGSHDIRRR